jgi:signal peptidase I
MESVRSSSVAHEIVTFALIALFVVIPTRLFIAQPFIVRGASMEPTFDNGQYLIVDQLSYHLHPPKRGDVVIFRYPKNPSVFFIKRIIGLPGETVELVGKDVIIDRGIGEEPMTLDESFLDPVRVRAEYGTYALSNNEYFVMGDNRAESSDSRSWGPLPKDDLVGRAIVRLFPAGTLGFFPGKIDFTK